MSEHIDPDLARALEAPAQYVHSEPEAVSRVRAAGAAAQQGLRHGSDRGGTAEDRAASAALLAAAFHDREPLARMATQGDGTLPGLLSLTDVPALQPVLRDALSRPVITGLLEWATQPDGTPVPLELAMAARDLHLDSHAVFRSVAGRAEQLAGTAPARERGPLDRLAEVLRSAATDRPTSADDDAPSRSSSHEPGPGAGAGSGPGVHGSPAAEDSLPASSSGSGTEQDLPADFRVPDDLSGMTGSTSPGAGTPEPGGSATASPHQDLPGTGEPVPDSLYGAESRGGAGSRGEGTPSAAEPEHYEPQPFDPRDGRPADPEPPRPPSTNELYYGVGSDRYADYDPASEQGSAAEKSMMRNWAIVFAVIVAVIVLLVILL